MNDEKSFFDWLDMMACVSTYAGRGDTLYITVESAAVDEEALRDLLALFHRYGVDLAQLQVFDTDRFTSWFRDPASYWFSGVFK